MSFAGGSHTPFWIANNQYGMSSIKKNNALLRGSVIKRLDESKRFSWGAGVDLALGARYSSVFFVQQLYAEAKYRCLDLMIGAKEMEGFMSDHDLASGNLLYSGNAHPIPQVRAGIFDYADVWGTKGFLGIKGYIAFGKFTENNWVKKWANPDTTYCLNTLYHSKALFLRIGNTKKFPLEYEMGLEMATQFGGDSYTDGVKLAMPHGLKAFLKALIPVKGGEGTPTGEQVNIEGNVLGSWNFSLAWKPRDKDWSVRFYYEHFFEDHSMLWIEFPWKDGLYGLQAKFPKNRFVNEAVYEYLYMKDQSGPAYWDHTPELNIQASGRDNYYNHYIYNGWENWGMCIGNPLIISPIYNPDHRMLFLSTRITAHHFSFKGQPLDELGYKVMLSYTRSWGTYEMPFNRVKSNFNLLAQVKYTPSWARGWEGKLGFGMDAGSLIGRSFGTSITIAKTGLLFGK